MRWHFSTKRPSDKTRDPVVAEFFSSDAIKDAGEALVREAVQNSLDARPRGETGVVKVRIFLSGEANALPANQCGQWFDTAWPHYLAAGNGLRPGDVSREKPCRFLVFEDFGTTGLTGDREQYEEQQTEAGAGADNPFFYFFRAEAKTAKYGDARGRWGIGKQVFPRSSRAQTFFGYSETEDGGFLMGGCILKHHTVDGVCHKPDGFLGESKDVLGDTLTVPVTDGRILADFRRDFHLTRGPGQHGLSVVVPWLDDAEDERQGNRAFDRNSLLLTILAGYFVPILEGRLEAKVEDSVGTANLTQATYREVLRTLKPDADAKKAKEIERLETYLELTERAKRRAFDSFDLEPCPTSKATWTETMLSEAMASQMREALAAGRTIRVSASLTVRPKGAEDCIDSFQCFIEKAPSLSGRPCHIREDLIISGVEASRVPGYACLVRVDKGALASLLGDSESPAHTEWHASSRNFKDKYIYGGLTIEFVSQFPAELLKRIHTSSRQLDRNLLMDLFSDKGPDPDPSVPREPGDRRSDRGDPRPPLPAPTPPAFRIGQLDNGFVVASAGGNVAIGAEMEIRAAYETAKGNPFSSYDLNDFQFSDDPLTVESVGCRILFSEANRLRVAIEQPDFRVTVLGFDVNRDVVVKANLQPRPEMVEAESTPPAV